MCGVVQVVRGCRVLFLLPDRFDPDKKRYFPPPLDLLLSWSTLFRSGQTLRNYLGYVQTACILFNAPTQVWPHRVLRWPARWARLCRCFKIPL